MWVGSPIDPRANLKANQKKKVNNPIANRTLVDQLIYPDLPLRLQNYIQYLQGLGIIFHMILRFHVKNKQCRLAGRSAVSTRQEFSNVSAIICVSVIRKLGTSVLRDLVTGFGTTNAHSLLIRLTAQ